jgi:hypothetical protein
VSLVPRQEISTTWKKQSAGETYCDAKLHTSSQKTTGSAELVSFGKNFYYVVNELRIYKFSIVGDEERANQIKLQIVA